MYPVTAAPSAPENSAAEVPPDEDDGDRVSITDVHGLFRWVSDGDIALLDGDHGLLVLNPTKVEMATAREQRVRKQPERRP